MISSDVERSSSIRSEIRPKVSFNRDVHVKRIRGSPREGARMYDDRYMNGDVNENPNGLTTTSRRRNSSATTASTYSRSRRTERGYRDERVREASPQPPPTTKKLPGLGQRIRAFFKRKSKDDESKEKTNDQLDSSHESSKGRRGSTYSGDERGSWFRSVDRLDRRGVNGGGGLRYFGESEEEGGRGGRARVKRGGSTVSGLRPPRPPPDSSTETDTSAHNSHRSLVYLHEATVGDIPGWRGRQFSSRTDLSSKGLMGPEKRVLSRSVSVLAPWTPRTRSARPEIDYSATSNTLQRPPRPPRSNRSTQTLTRGGRVAVRGEQQPVGGKSPLRDLVFTGPSIEETLRKGGSHRAPSTIIHLHPDRHLRSRK